MIQYAVRWYTLLYSPSHCGAHTPAESRWFQAPEGQRGTPLHCAVTSSRQATPPGAGVLRLAVARRQRHRAPPGRHPRPGPAQAGGPRLGGWARWAAARSGSP